MRVMKAKCQGARDESEGAEHGSEGVSPGCLVCVCVSKAGAAVICNKRLEFAPYVTG